MATIDIAKETTAEAINTNLGDYTDASSASGTTVFSRMKYAVSAIGDILAQVTPARMSKIDAIGSAADSTSTESVFGKLNKAIADMDTGSQTDTAQSETLVSSAISGSGSLAGTFLAPVTRVYKVSATLKASASGTSNAAQLICARTTITASASGTLIMTRASTTAAAQTARIYLIAGQTYYFYIFGGGTPQISALALAYGTMKEDLSMPSLTASTDYTEYIPMSTASGTGTTETKVAEWKVLYYGSVKVRVTRDSTKAAYTYWKLYRNNTVISTNTASTQTVSVDVDVNKGDVLKLTGYGSGASADWEIDAVEMQYTVSFMGTNSLIIQI